MKSTILSLLPSLLLVNCSPLASQPSHTDATATAVTQKINHVDAHAMRFKARYGTEYEIRGNVIAEYPDFYLSLHKTTIDKHKHIISTYQLASKIDDNVTFLDLDSSALGRKHFYLEGHHFYCHSNKPHTINIYYPPQLLALQSADSKQY